MRNFLSNCYLILKSHILTNINMHYRLWEINYFWFSTAQYQVGLNKINPNLTST